MIQFVAVFFSKGSAYLVTIYIYSVSKDDTTSFFLMNSISSFLGPILLFGNGAIITKNEVDGKKDIVGNSLINYLAILGFFAIILSFFDDTLFSKTIILSSCWAMFNVLHARARAYDKYETVIISLFKAIIFFSSIFLLGIYDFSFLIFLALILFFVLKKEITLNKRPKLTLISIVNSSKELTVYSLFRWIMNSSDKLILYLLDFPFINDYTFLYTICSGVSLFTNALSMYIPRLVYNRNKINFDFSKIARNVLIFSFIINVLGGFIYFSMNDFSYVFYVSFFIISVSLIINGMSISTVSEKINVENYKILVKAGFISSITAIILFLVVGAMTKSLILISTINVLIFGTYLLIIKNEKKRK